MERVQVTTIGSQKEKDILLNAAEQWRMYYHLPESDRLPLQEWQETMRQGIEMEGIAPGHSDRLSGLAELEASMWEW
jgi:hypothetical protein